MMPSDRFDRRLPGILEEISQPRTPDYFDDLIGLAARTRQRPAWTLLERWLPMADIARQPAFARQVPWRPIAVLALILLLVAASLALVIGSRHPLPAPFGLAKNGLVAYATAGDIYTADAATGNSKAIVSGPEKDLEPRWSRDGTSVAFQRMADGNSNAGDVYVVRPNGSDLIRVTREPLVGITGYDFSPDGKQLLISADVNGTPSLLMAATDGSGIRQLDLPVRVTDAAWRPPDGAEILFMDEGTDSSGLDSGIYAVSVRDAKVRTILKGADAAGRFRGHATWSPDGSLISFGEWMGINGIDVQTHVITQMGLGIASCRSRPTRCGKLRSAGRMMAPGSSPSEVIPAISRRTGPSSSPSTGMGPASRSRIRAGSILAPSQTGSGTPTTRRSWASPPALPGLSLIKCCWTRSRAPS